MKITKIETVRLTSRPTLIWVRVHTDEGLIGLGESWFGCAAVDADIHERIAPALIGADPSRIEALTSAARPYVGFCGTGAEIRAASRDRRGALGHCRADGRQATLRAARRRDPRRYPRLQYLRGAGLRLAVVGRQAREFRGSEHQLDAFCDRRIVF